MGRKAITPINIGDRFGQLMVVECVGYKPGLASKINYYRCLCACGAYKDIRRNHLLAKKTLSCGCYQRTHMLNPKGDTAHNILYGICRHSAVKRNLLFNLTLQEHKELIVKSCHYCGRLPRSYRDIFINGIDRVDNTKGYVKDNCVPCCQQCNHSKKNYSVEDYINHCKMVVEHQKQRSN